MLASREALGGPSARWATPPPRAGPTPARRRTRRAPVTGSPWTRPDSSSSRTWPSWGRSSSRRCARASSAPCGPRRAGPPVRPWCHRCIAACDGPPGARVRPEEAEDEPVEQTRAAAGLHRRQRGRSAV